MNIRPLAIFAAGALFATALVGTTAWLQASSENTITACANKKTGAMRYLTKGRCKKTETAVSWSNIGPVGPQGTKGDTGAIGQTGPKGEDGPKGKDGTKGEDGTKAIVVDSNGKEMGVWAWTNSVNYFAFADASGAVWIPEIGRYRFANAYVQYFRDANCTIPLIKANSADSLPSSSDRWIRLGLSQEEQIRAAYRISGTTKPFSGTTLSGVYRTLDGSDPTSTTTTTSTTSTLAGIYQMAESSDSSTCYNDKNRAGNTLGDYSSIYFWDTEEVPLPTYTPPLSIRVR
jgi:hypothetical protein